MIKCSICSGASIEHLPSTKAFLIRSKRVPSDLLSPGRSAVLIGDHLQLPPTVFMPNADELLVSRSLFERFCVVGILDLPISPLGIPPRLIFSNDRPGREEDRKEIDETKTETDMDGDRELRDRQRRQIAREIDADRDRDRQKQAKTEGDR
eukprot:s1098_g13.t1